VISARLRDACLGTHVRLTPQATEPPYDFVANKGSNAIRTALAVRTTLDRSAQNGVANFLRRLKNAPAVSEAGLDQRQLLDRGDPQSVIYSVTLYERGEDANLLRVQTDNFNQPLDINQGTRLQLGSTAKLRTLINYLQIIEHLHHQMAGLLPAELRGVPILPGDRLTQWAVGYLSAARNRSLEPMLRAALERTYSASPHEAFFTAGGLHDFENFEPSEDGRVMSVSEGFQESVNLVFIRLMRDIERYYRFRVPGASPSVLTDTADPGRLRYLQRFADCEGRTFLRRFYEKYKGRTPDQALHELAAGVRLTLGVPP
jgi:membrane peptidoglycan carboxypeptidase